MINKLYIKRADVFLIGGILSFGFILGLLILLTQHVGSKVQISVDGEVAEVFSLSEDGTYEINGVDGGTNILIIDDGKAWVGEASCPDGLCMKMGKISQYGQSIVCLPNKVVVEIMDNTKKSSGTEIDAISR